MIRETVAAAQTPATAVPSAADRPLRIALLAYRGDPFCGGQGVYVRHLSRELARLGHHVEVITGPPYAVVDDVPGNPVKLTKLPSLDLYREPDPFRMPALREYRDWIDVLEVGGMLAAGFPEPLTFSLRAARHLRGRRDEFDVVHDNQTLGYGQLALPRMGFPLVTTIHHPITVDRGLELAEATTLRRKITLRRWYGFTTMQKRVSARLPEVVTVSGSSKAEIVEHLGVSPSRVKVIHVGADTELFSPSDAVAKVPGRIVTTASADVPLKGLIYLVEALAKLRTERDAELVVVGKPRPDGPVMKAIDRLGLTGAVRFVSDLTDAELVDLVRSAEVACVPSLYEGFSLPAAEAMSCGTALVASTGGAIPEVAGPDGETCLAVPPGDAEALRVALGRLLDDADLRARLAAAGRARVLEHFTWRNAAARTAERYRAAIEAAGAKRGA
ncbi:glycosyltransferase family 4 protein [Yinghuangia seranimata]|uniref:glycosyltransferase family 4 protein n=1 Tax=Yinghuangia seranimata TaxID=408067 RepID=UPI00248C5594|nr:glycosyltransferase family 4 protein [Yinghuangia seranimata]MDI2128538.1 glycosyltransferase family 4 protein [Yinghuangia seranimata]